MIALTLLAFASEAPEVALFQRVLTEYVTEDGKVRYAVLHDRIEPLDRFVTQIAAVTPDSHPALFPSREAKLAYWLNAYNALVLWAFAKDYPQGQDRLSGKIGQLNFFFRRKFRVGGVERSLDDIETKSVRRAFGDPRIHFALVCASESCPWLSRTAYTAENLEKELEARTRLFVNQSRNVTVDEKTGTLRLSKIFEWYEGDFGGRAKLLEFLDRYRDQKAARLAGRSWKIGYFDYSWKLNRV
jgi:hypothetical protein